MCRLLQANFAITTIHMPLSAGYENATARPAPALPPAPHPTWPRSEPSGRCSFVYHAGEVCAIPRRPALKCAITVVLSRRSRRTSPWVWLGDGGGEGHCVPRELRRDTGAGVRDGFDGALGFNGASFILGKSNVATKLTGLIGKVATGSALVVKNPS
jgi:hypothetical protein